MSSQPELKPSDLIEITGSHPIPAVVTSSAFEDEAQACPQVPDRRLSYCVGKSRRQMGGTLWK